MKPILVFLLSIVLTGSLIAQTDCACCTETHKQFDFWLGDWIVLDTLGNEVGTVSQLWEIFDLNDILLHTAFLGIYHRKE